MTLLPFWLAEQIFKKEGWGVLSAVVWGGCRHVHTS